MVVINYLFGVVGLCCVSSDEPHNEHPLIEPHVAHVASLGFKLLCIRSTVGIDLMFLLVVFDD